MDKLHYKVLIFFTVIALFSSSHHLVKCQQENATASISTHDITVIVSDTEEFSIQLDGIIDQTVDVTLQVSHAGLIHLQPSILEFSPSSGGLRNVTIVGISPGHIEITATAKPEHAIDINNIFVRVIVALSPQLITISSLIGWSYFLAWSISFYSQITINYKRKSVVGLSFDFLSFNIVGFSLYAVFNIGLYSIPEIENEYSRRFPRGLNPVQMNDIFFACHATFAALFTIIQCFVYERGDQRVSNIGRSILAIFAVWGVLSAILATFNVIHWLDFLYQCSYIKLSITFIKYVPQAIFNYKRKSTVGWSIECILLDLTGGILSMLQMVVNAYNYDDWASIFGDLTKFGMGIFTVLFDTLFILQHYVFYRESIEKLVS